MAKKGNNNTGNALKFIASLFFLYVVFVGASNGWWSAWVSGPSNGSVWLPLLVAIGVIGSIALFFGSIAGMAKGIKVGNNLFYATALSLVALTVSPQWSIAFWISIVGFVIGWLGITVESCNM